MDKDLLEKKINFALLSNVHHDESERNSKVLFVTNLFIINILYHLLPLFDKVII